MRTHKNIISSRTEVNRIIDYIEKCEHETEQLCLESIFVWLLLILCYLLLRKFMFVHLMSDNMK